MDVFALPIAWNRRARSLKPGIDETLRHFLDSWIGMTSDPALILDSIVQIPVLGREMVLLADVRDLDLQLTFPRHRKSNRVPGAVLRQARAAQCVSQAAFIVQPLGFRDCALVSGRRAMSFPPATQRQTPGMKPSGLVRFTGRHEEGTGQGAAPCRLARRFRMSKHCTQRGPLSPVHVKRSRPGVPCRARCVVISVFGRLRRSESRTWTESQC